MDRDDNKIYRVYIHRQIFQDNHNKCMICWYKLKPDILHWVQTRTYWLDYQ